MSTYYIISFKKYKLLMIKSGVYSSKQNILLSWYSKKYFTLYLNIGNKYVKMCLTMLWIFLREMPPKERVLKWTISCFCMFKPIYNKFPTFYITAYNFPKHTMICPPLWAAISFHSAEKISLFENELVKLETRDTVHDPSHWISFLLFGQSYITLVL